MWTPAALLSLSLLLSAAQPPATEAPWADPQSLLPSCEPFDGSSRELMLPPDHPWVTPAERTGLTETPSYDETVAWLQRLVAAAPELQMMSIGTSPEGRAIWMVIASAEGAPAPEQLLRGGKPTLLAHGGIHAGEIDGKDAGLMLLRDLTVTGRLRPLLDHANLLFIPILNVDGHERTSPYNRINQRGPRSMGWRTNARNLNLNRDFAKLDTPEVRALVAVINRWQPDLYVDLHVTDGADYQYDITWGYNGAHGHSPAITAWLEGTLTPAVSFDLGRMEHVPGPLIFLSDAQDPAKGNISWHAGPRYSNGYGDARHLPSVLVENHSLKPYDQRVLGTYVLLESALRTLGQSGAELRRAVAADRARRQNPLVLTWELPGTPPSEFITFLGIDSRIEPSPISGDLRQVWTGEPFRQEIPQLTTTQPVLSATRPAAYWVPATWPEVIERLELHGIEMERIAEPRQVKVEMYRLEDPKLEVEPFEGHVRVDARPVPETLSWTFPPGSVRVSTDQPLGDLAMLLLEPASPDSFWQWGFFLEVLQRTEYFEAYAIEPLAERMLAQDPALAAEFQHKLETDAAFAANPQQRLEWFYSRSPFQDARWRLYPVARELASAATETP